MARTRTKTPTVPRSFLLVVLLASAPITASAQGPTWTDADAVAAAMATPELEALTESRLAELRAELASRTAVPNPRLELDHDQALSPSASGRETSISVSQKFDLIGWRGGLRDARPHLEAATKADGDALRLDVATQVRLAFYAVVYHRERVDALANWVSRLQSGAEAIGARKARGDASGYDLKRMQRELDTARAELAAESTQLAEAWADLERWVPWSLRPTLTGDLTPAPPVDTVATHPDVVRLENLERAARLERDAWGSPMLRGWEIGAGYKNVNEDSVAGHGLLVTLSVPLVLWSNAAPTLDGLRARELRLGAERKLLTTRNARAQTSAQLRLRQALDALRALPAADTELTSLAATAYDAGEIRLGELLEAHQAETQYRLARTDLAWEARRASIELDRSRGQGVAQ